MILNDYGNCDDAYALRLQHGTCRNHNIPSYMIIYKDLMKEFTSYSRMAVYLNKLFDLLNQEFF